MSKQERLNRYLARTGVASRRASDRLIQAGLVEVNGQRVLHPGTRIDPESDTVRFEGQAVTPPPTHTYVLLNKPPGYLVSTGDPHHTRTVFDLLRELRGRVFPVGRLDLDTQGVLLLTDDGDLAHRLMHPRWGVEKTYRARVRGEICRSSLRALSEGVALADGPTAPAKVRLIARGAANGPASGRGESTVELTLAEGRKRQVRRMCEAVGHRVLGLNRTCFGGLTARGVPRGGWRHLESAEVAALRRAVGLAAED